jgi:hypothetical protein
VANRYRGHPRAIRIDVEEARIAAVPALLTAGERDDDTALLDLQHDASQAGYGSNRVARLAVLADNLSAHGSSVQVELAPGAGHSGNPTLAIAQRFLADLIGGARSRPAR